MTFIQWESTAIDGQWSLVTVYGQAYVATCNATCCNTFRDCRKLKSCSLCAFASLNRACCGLHVFHCFLLNPMSFIVSCFSLQAESKEIPSLGSWKIILKVFEMFEDGQTFMAFWKRMILKEPSYYTTTLISSSNCVTLGPFYRSSQFHTCYAKSCSKDLFLLHPALLWGGSCESNAHLISFSVVSICSLLSTWNQKWRESEYGPSADSSRPSTEVAEHGKAQATQKAGWIPRRPLTSHSNWGHDWNELTVLYQ